MGLDLYAYAAPRHTVTQPVDFEYDPDIDFMHYWSKHPNLHGWMQNLYLSKGGVSEDFNFAPVELTLDDLERLEADVRNGALPPTSGPFFGRSSGSEIVGDLKFIAKARLAIASGLAVFYLSAL